MTNPSSFRLSQSAQAEANRLDRAFGIKPPQISVVTDVRKKGGTLQYKTTAIRPKVKTYRPFEAELTQAIQTYGTPVSVHKHSVANGQLPTITQLSERETFQYAIAFRLAYELLDGKLRIHHMIEIARDLGLRSNAYLINHVKAWLAKAGLITLESSFRGVQYGRIVSFNF